MLSATGLKKRYKQREVVRDFSCRVDQGEVVGLLGPNGAGKTTCFYMIVGLVGADAGSIRLDDTDITAQPMHARARLGLGYLPQEASVFRRLSVADNILAILELRPGLDAAALAAEPRFMLLDEPFAGVDPISVGEIQRIVRHLKERGIGVLITDHNVRETLGICDRAYILSEGKVLAKGAPATILANEQVREVYLGKEFRM